MISLCRRVAASRRFQDAILAIIVANAVLIGLETSAALWERHGALFHALNLVVQVVFAVEIAIRLLAHAPRFDRFFRDGWKPCPRKATAPPTRLRLGRLAPLLGPRLLCRASSRSPIRRSRLTRRRPPAPSQASGTSMR